MEISPYARDAFESEWFDSFALNVRDGFFDRIGRVEQIQTGRADSFRARHSDCPLTRLCKVRILTA